MRYDFHVHTHHSGDGRCSVDEMAQGALARGVDELCFTSHYDVDFPSTHHNFHLDIPAYVRDVRGAQRRYEGEVGIRLGIEVGMQPHKPQTLDVARAEMAGVPFDFVIGSLHTMPGHDYHRAHIWREQGVSRAQVQALYLDTAMQALARFDDFDVLAHLTYYSRYAPPATPAEMEMVYEDNAKAYDDLFVALIEQGKGLEINSSVKSTLGFFCPDYSLLRRYRELGGKIVTIGSDAHDPWRLGEHYEAAQALLKAAGFRCSHRFVGRQPLEISL